ncbi:enoyl-CoA hydratase/isomerase family protein [Henriciella mobilis]|uniref:Enoyl-CoA hydratase/isomerase family protein n=1 Tax=Henriciella mobilis TaxID=2305467 RepID=A0A399RG11_9PROT|nr:enoyl-CoA hydratase-related protein [Henriciella mobilis]RIJ30540.1 enoyl-CoA hydratase/isomerase family protein [Henriciella mobilis]
MSEILKIETHDHISVLTLNRPEAMNALDYPLYAALEDAVRESEARCMIITGAGERAFCSGDDVKQILSKGAPSDESMAKRSQKTGGLTPAADALLHTDIPVIAAINGFALGWGAELAIMADIRVMADTAKFGEIFVKRGLCCDAPGLGRLAQLVGREQASELLFTGDIIDAARAKEIGLVSRVVPQADLLPTALGIAQKIAANPPQAVQALKAGLRRTLDPDWRDTGLWAITEIRRLMQTEDARESAAAFIEKRDPVFTGR